MGVLSVSRGQGATARRWKERGFTALAVKVAIIAFPLAVGVVTATIVNGFFPRPAHGFGMLLWWAGTLGASAVAVGLVMQQVQRLLPLAALLRLSLAFPDHTPSRARIALRAGSVTGLQRRIAELKERGGEQDADVGTAAETVVTLAAGLTVHDRKTRGHSERVRALSELIAEQMHVEQPERDHLRWASLLHDCGKVMVDPGILNKTGKLDAEEWEVIRRHPEEGGRIAAPLRAWLGDWCLAIEQHHERWDGSGYPKGLKGEEISLAARIVAVADAFDAMTSLRSYQTAMSPAAARAELTAKAGIDFDPQVVRAFLLISPGRVNRVLGPLAWLAQIPLAGTAVASAATTSANKARNAAAAVGGTGAVAAAAAMGLVAPAVTTPVASPAPAVAAPAPQSEPPVIRILPVVSPTPEAAPAAPATASAPTAAAPATSGPPVRHAAFAQVPSNPAPASQPAPAPPPSSPPAPPGPAATPASLVSAEVNLPLAHLHASVAAVPGACVQLSLDNHDIGTC